MSFITSKYLRSAVATVLVAGALVIASGVPAHADGSTLHTWTGDGDHHSWTDAGNWNGGVPQDGDSVTIESHNGGCSAPVDSVPTITLQDFTLTNGDGCGSSVSGGAITVDGTFSWDEGTLATPVTLAAGSTGTISGTGTDFGKTLEADLTVASTLTLSDATFTLWAPNVLHVLSGATLHTSGADDVEFSACCVNPARITNNGTLSVDDGALSVDAVAVDQHGLMTVADGATATLAGPGKLGPGTYSGPGRLILGTGQSAQLTGKNTLGAGFHLELAGGTLAGKGSIAGKGSFDWSGGTLAATTNVLHGASMHVYGAAAHGLPAPLTDHGTVTVDGQATVQMSGPTTLTVPSDGVLSTAPGISFTTTGCCTNPNRIINAGGKVIVPAASGAVTPGTPATVSGDTYQATGGSTSVAPGEVLAITGGALGTLQDTTVTGGGTVSLRSPTTLTGTVTVASATTLALGASGALTGTGTVAGPGELDWIGGSFGGTPTVAAALDVSGAAAKAVAQGGTVTVTGPMNLASGTTGSPNSIGMAYSMTGLHSIGATTIGHDVAVHGGVWTNDGSLTVAAGDGGKATFDQNARLVNNGIAEVATGTLSVTGSYQQAAGSTAVDSGATLSAPVSVTGGTLAGIGTLTGAVQNTGGTVAPGPVSPVGARGTLTVTGSYTQGPGGRLALDLAGSAAGKHDLLAVSGAANLAGVIESTSRSGYAPPSGTSVTVLTRGSGSGSFECGFSAGFTGRWLPSYTSTAVAVARGAAGASGCLVYQPAAPVRAPSTVSVGSGAAKTVDLRGIGGVSASTPAVTVNLSVDTESGGGALRAFAAGVPSTATAVRFRSGVPAAQQVTVALTNGQLQLQTTAGTVHVHLDVLGVFADGQGHTGALAHPLQPAALPSVAVTSGSDLDVPVAGSAGVPTGASAVTATVTVRSPTASGVLAVLPGGGPYSGTESVAVQPGQPTSNLVTTVLDSSGQLRLHLTAGSAQVSVTVVGWYGTDGTGSWTVPVSPAVVSTVALSGSEADPSVVGVGGVPAGGATSVLVSEDVTADSAAGELSVGGRNAPMWPAVEIASPGAAGAPAQIIPGQYNEAAERLSAGSAQVALAIFGYTVG